MKELIKKRHLIPIAVWFVIYMGLFGFLEIVPPKDVHLIHCALDDRIPNMAIFIYPYVSWFPYIVVCAALAIKNLDDRQFKKAVLVLTTGMNIFLFISYVWPTGLDLRDSIVYDLHTLSGNLLKFVQTVDTPKSVFPSMHVYVTLVLQYTLEMQKKLVSYNKKLRDIAGIDPLTGLRNRRSEIEQILEKIRKYQNGEVQALTIAIGDIDFFKRINDTYGHNCGDIVLRELADLFKTFMRTKGDVCRWGGEEFLFIFNDINGDDASYMLQELRAEIQKRGINFGQEVIHATMTFGVAEYDLRRSLEHNIEDADQKLYIGKEKGRNIIIY